MKWDFNLVRKSLNRLNLDTAKKHLREIAGSAERNKTLGFESKVGKIPDPEVIHENGEDKYLYKVRIRLTDPKSRTKDIAQEKCHHILRVVARCAATKGWLLVTGDGLTIHDDGEVGQESAVSASTTQRTPFILPVYDKNAHSKWFQGVYDRDAHIRIIYRSVRSYVESKGEERSHVLLEGKPAGCKTKLFERFKGWFEDGSETERVAFIDGPTMTKAGLENWLLNNASDRTLPEILVVEEIEKQSMDNLLTLLSVMGSGYVAKTNARIGRNREDAKILVWATCNDLDKLLEFRAGALYSRFSHQLHCVRPSRELMLKILLDKVRVMNGNEQWAYEALAFGYDVLKTDDPRKINGLLDGRDDLITGEFQSDYLSIIKAMEGEKNRDENRKNN